MAMPFQWLLSKGLLFKKVLPKQVASACVVVVGRDMLINCAKICLYVDFLAYSWRRTSVCLYVVVCHLDHSLVIPAPKTKNTVYNELFPVCGGGCCTNGTSLVEIVCKHVPIPQQIWAEDYGFCVHCPIIVMRCWEVEILQDSKF
jgi:hypothetical protein